MKQRLIFPQLFFLSFRKKIISAMFVCMFKSEKRPFPLGTFVPTPLRVIAIIHLCIAFSALFYDIGYPFLGQLFENKRLHHLYESVFADKMQLQQLQHSQKRELIEGFSDLQKTMQTPFMTKFNQSISILLFGLPPFQKAWLFFSVIIPILILLKIEGAQQTAWLLPIICAIFLFNQIFLSPHNRATHEEKLFPSEELIINDYLKQQLPSNILEQKKSLTEGWQLYLIDRWGNEVPSSDQQIFQNQLSNAEFRFHIARINAIKKDQLIPPYLSKRSPLISLFFLIWSLFFAWFVNQRRWFIPFPVNKFINRREMTE